MKKINQSYLTIYQSAVFLLIATYGFFIAIGSNSAFPGGFETNSPMPFLYDKPVGEDGFYMLMVAWNLSEGKGLVANFDQKVTGIQPLATLLFSAVAIAVKLFNGDKVDFIRAVLAFGALNTILFAFLIARLTTELNKEEEDSKISSFLASIFACASFYIYRLSTYGLETGIYLVCIVFLLIQYIKVKEECKLTKAPLTKNLLLFGILVGVTGLARIDFGVVFFIFILYSAIKDRQLFLPLIVAGAIGAIVLAPWIIYVFLVTGTPIPSSGPAQASLISMVSFQDRISAMYSAFIQNLMPIIFVGEKWYTLAFSSVLTFILILMAARQRILAKLGCLIDWAFPLLSLLPIYMVFFWATHFYARYTAPLLVLAIPILSVLMCLNLKKLLKINLGPAVTAIGVICVFFAFATMSLHRGKVGNSHLITAGWVAKEKPNEIIGAFQSGVIGYVNEKTVNLDGKVNFDVLPYVKMGNVDEYLRKNEQIKVIIDWPDYINKFISQEYLEHDWRLCVDGTSWGSIGYCRKEK
jgi:hypothetical protein